MDKSESFKEAYQQNFELIYRYCFRRLSNKQDTEDVVSEVFTAAWANWSNLNITQKPELEVRKIYKAWLFGITTHKLTDFLRKKYKFNAEFVHTEIELADPIAQNLEHDIADTDDAEAKPRNPQANILSELVANLKEREKKFAKLRFEQNYKLAEIADELGLTLNNTKVIQNRLLKKLKSMYEAR